jgi:hypothetical protein
VLLHNIEQDSRWNYSIIAVIFQQQALPRFRTNLGKAQDDILTKVAIGGTFMGVAHHGVKGFA